MNHKTTNYYSSFKTYEWHNNVLELKKRCPDLHITYFDYNDPNIEDLMDCDDGSIWTLFTDDNGNKKWATTDSFSFTIDGEEVILDND